MGRRGAVVVAEEGVIVIGDEALVVEVVPVAG
jgi:hypothetical protein